MKVSVIVPCYNYAAYLADSIGSVLRQTHQDLELILIDDGSTDDTPEVAKAISDPRFKYLRIDNSGVSIARNIGIDRADGKFIAFLDADDIWVENKLEMQLKLFAQDPELDLVFSDLKRFTAQGELANTQFTYVPELQAMRKTSSLDGLGYIINDKPFETLGNTDYLASWIPTLLIRRECLGSLRFPPGVKLCEDYIFIMQLYAQIRKAGYINLPLVRVRRHDSNSYLEAKEMFAPKIEAIQSLKQCLTHQNETAILEQRLTDEYLHTVYHNFWYGSVSKALYYSVKLLFRSKGVKKALKYLFLAPAAPILRAYRKRSG
jgi:glycosyltransferase involved in cell wall biosynthesis